MHESIQSKNSAPAWWWLVPYQQQNDRNFISVVKNKNSSSITSYSLIQIEFVIDFIDNSVL